MGALSVADVLDRAADLIEPEGAWTQDTFCRDAKGKAVCLGSDRAVCFCAVGALYTVAPELMAVRAADYLATRVRTEFFSEWNDSGRRTQAEVVAKLREAAAIARGESPHV